MEYRLSDATAVLSRTPATLRALLSGLPAAWLDSREDPEAWSPFEVVGHLVLAEEELWIPRARSILEFGEEAVFDSFDRRAHLDRFRGARVEEVLDRFGEARRASLDAFSAMDLDRSSLARRGRHPAFGAVTLSQLLATWVAHDLTHVRQIVRTMAREYEEAVGPWVRYLRVMDE